MIGKIVAGAAFFVIGLWLLYFLFRALALLSIIIL